MKNINGDSGGWNNLTNIVQDEPVNCSSHSDGEENIGEVATSEEDKHHEHLMEETESFPLSKWPVKYGAPHIGII